MKIIYMGTPDFAIPALVALFNKGFDISLVVTQKDKPKGRGKQVQFTSVKEKAMELGLDVFQPENINDSESIKRIKEVDADFIIVAAYGQILKTEILSIPKYACLNIHASLLPLYRGAAPINWSIINNELTTGITIMKMNEGLDSGDIVLVESIAISKKDDSEILYKKLSELGGKLIIEAVLNYKEIQAEEQDHSKKSYAPMLKKEHGIIDWTKQGKDVINLVRGLKPWPIAYTHYKGEVLKIYQARFEKGNNDINTMGIISKISKDGIYVNVKDGYVIIEELQFPGKKRLTVQQYLVGNKIEIGTILV